MLTGAHDPMGANWEQLVGHSLGGSVIVRACPLLQELKYRITGVAVLDIVEGALNLPCDYVESHLHLRRARLCFDHLMPIVTRGPGPILKTLHQLCCAAPDTIICWMGGTAIHCYVRAG